MAAIRRGHPVEEHEMSLKDDLMEFTYHLNPDD